MTKTLLVAAAALALMTAGAFAQPVTSSTTSTQSTTSAPTLPSVSSSSSTQQTTGSDGTVTNKTQTYTNGATIAPSGDVTTTRRSTDTTTTR
jgi:hypothetical protein